MIVTVEIPCGSPQTYFTNPDNARAWAIGNSGGTIPYADLIDAKTAPHDTSTMSAPDDGAWLSMDQAGFHADMLTRGYPGDGNPYFLTSAARMDYPASIPAGLTELLIRPVFRARTSTTAPPRQFQAIAYTGNGAQNFFYSSPDITTIDWIDNSAAGFSSVFSTSIEAARTALNAGLGHVTVAPYNWGRNGDAPDPAPTWVDDIDYMAIQLQYEVPGCPPLRQFPRTDGLATSSARRMWPPSRSRQRSNRRAGGYL